MPWTGALAPSSGLCMQPEGCLCSLKTKVFFQAPNALPCRGRCSLKPHMLRRMRAAQGRPDEVSPQPFESPFAREGLRQLAASQGTASDILETLQLHAGVSAR